MPRWKKWLLRLFFTGVLLLVVMPLLARWYVRYEGLQHLARVTARLDADDPGWQLDDILAAREKEMPPADQNIYTITEKLLNPKEPEAYRSWTSTVHEWLPPAGTPNLPFETKLAAARKARDDCRAEIDQLHKIRGMSRGGFRLKVTPIIIDVDLADVQRLRTAAGLLSLDAAVSATADRDADRALRGCHATLNCGKAISGDISLIEMLVRVAMSGIAVGNTERVLGWGEPTTGLAELQAAFLAEADVPLLAHANRGERAMMSRLFDNIENGSATAAGVGFPGGVPSGFAMRTFLPENHALYLEHMTAFLAAARRPPHERGAMVNAIPSPPSGDFRYMFLQLVLPAMDRMSGADSRRIAQLRSAAVALACERYRRAKGTWPKALADIPADILPAIPQDPYDGNPIRYFRAEDGLIAYSVGPDGADDGGKLSRTYRADAVGEDYGVRLWDADKRRATPLPDTGPEDRP